MKQRFFFFAALCAAALVSCTPKEIVVDTPEENAPAVENLIPITITASLDGVKSDMDGAAWTWKSGDRLAVYDGTAKREFTLDPSADGQSVAIFSGSVSSTEGLKAVFPFEAAGAEFGTPAIPSDQSIPSGATIAPDAMIAVANTAEKVSDSEFNFYFTSGISLLRLTPPAGATKVIIHTAAKGETLAGDSPSVTINLADADGSKQFWAAVQPAKYTGIRIFTLKSDSKYYLLKTDAEIDLSTPGKGKKLGSLAAGTEVSVIEDGAGLVSYLSGSPVLDGYIVKDIDLSGKTITSCSSFSRLFDGQYHIIDRWTSSATALFSSVGAAGIVKDFTVGSNCALTFPDALSDFGFVVASNSGTVTDIAFDANTTVSVIVSGAADGHFGCVVGINNAGGTMSYCSTSGNMTYSGTGLTGDKNLYVGGVIGKAAEAISHCFNSGDLTFTYTDNVMTKCLYLAGICGQSVASVSDCNNEGEVMIKTKGGATTFCLVAAGIVGYATGTISSCNNNVGGSISVISESDENAADGPLARAVAAGVAGYAAGNVTSCDNYAPVLLRGGYSNNYGGIGSLTGVSSVVAGVVGLTYNANVSECDNHSSVTSRLYNIDNSGSKYNTTTRATIGGIVGNQQGTISSCTNSGPVTAYWVTFAHSAAMAKNFVSQAGGITGGSYVALDKTKSSIVSCINEGSLSITCDSSGSNNAFGGIVGWPGSESATSIHKVTDCQNLGNITVDGYGKARTGGISGAPTTLQGNTNKGTVYLKQGHVNSCVGGILGYANHLSITDNTNYGNVCSDVNITNNVNGDPVTNYETQAGIGGLVGGSGNTGFTFTGNSVNCIVTAPTACKFASMIIGMIDRDKTAASGNALSIGTEAKPIKVKGKFGSTVLTEGNYSDYIKYSGYLNLNASVTFNTEFGE